MMLPHTYDRSIILLTMSFIRFVDIKKTFNCALDDKILIVNDHKSTCLKKTHFQLNYREYMKILCDDIN